MDKFSMNSARGVLFERNDVEENNRRDFPVTALVDIDNCFLLFTFSILPFLFLYLLQNGEFSLFLQCVGCPGHY